MRFSRIVLGVLILLFAGGIKVAMGHITPPVVYISDRDAVVQMTEGAKKYFVREIKLSSDEKEDIRRQWGWRAADPFYRFYIGRDETGKMISAVTFLTEFTIHGPLRVAVAIAPDGKVKGAKIIESTEETSTWVRPLINGNFSGAYQGKDSHGNFGVPASHALGQENMIAFYHQVAANLIQRGAILYEVAFLNRGE